MDYATGGGKASSARYRIGGLLDILTMGEYTPDAWNGISDTVEASGGHLVNVCGGFLDVSPFNEYERYRNQGFDLMDLDSFDGIVVVGGTLANYTKPVSVEAFYRRFSAKPVISVGPAPSGVAHTIIDNEQGMRELIQHLITVHGYRRIAFIRGPVGNTDAEQRYGVYRECLEASGIALDQSLVQVGDFNEASGGAAVAALMAAGRKFEAVVASNDNMAIGAMIELKRRGLRVPMDVAVTGFDDTVESRSFIPTLTTVRQPIADLGKLATRILFDWISSGVRPPERTVLPAVFVPRRSCGCMSSSEDLAVSSVGKSAAAAAASPSAASPSTASPSTASSPGCELSSAILDVFKRFKASPGEAAARALAKAFNDSVAPGAPDSFATALSQGIEESMATGNEPAAWQDVVSSLNPALGCSDPAVRLKAEAVIGRSRIIVSEIIASDLMRERIKTQRLALTLMRIGGELVTSFKIEEFTEVLMRALPSIGIQSAALFSYADPAAPREGCRCVFAIKDGADARGEFGSGVLPSDTRAFRALGAKEGPDSWMLQPLYYRDRQLGFLVMHQSSRKANIYESFHVQLCGSLEGAALLERSQAMERAISERSAAIEALILPMLASLEEITAITAKHGEDSSRLEKGGTENAKKVEATEKVAMGIQEMLGKANTLAEAIADISETIDIVALNASIEAAHAGAFGRGFSVISGEIRKLSDSTKKNIQEINSFLTKTNDGIKGFIGANRELKEAFANFNDAISRVTVFLSDLRARLDGIQSSSQRILETMTDKFEVR